MLSKYALHQNNFYFYTPDLDYELVKQLNRWHVRSLDDRCVASRLLRFHQRLCWCERRHTER